MHRNKKTVVWKYNLRWGALFSPLAEKKDLINGIIWLVESSYHNRIFYILYSSIPKILTVFESFGEQSYLSISSFFLGSKRRFLAPDSSFSHYFDLVMTFQIFSNIVNTKLIIFWVFPSCR